MYFIPLRTRNSSEQSADFQDCKDKPVSKDTRIKDTYIH